jgi:hypothetical protein
LYSKLKTKFLLTIQSVISAPFVSVERVQRNGSFAVRSSRV